MTPRQAIVLLLPYALALQPLPAQENLGFERHTDQGLPLGWTVDAAGYDVAVDKSFASDGRYSLRISGRSAEPGAAAQVKESIDVAGMAGNQARVSAFVRSKGVLQSRVFVHVRAYRADGTFRNDAQRIDSVTGNTDWHPVSLAVPLTEDVAWITIAAYLEGEGSAWFDDFTFAVVDVDALPPPSPEVEAYVSAAVDLMQEYSIRRDAIDWPSLRESTLKSIRGVDSLPGTYSALRRAIYQLGDRHSSFMTPQRVEMISTAGSDAEFDRAWLSPNGERLAGHIGYVSIPAFSGFNQDRVSRFADEVQTQIRMIDTPEVCGWIVDLRENRGGNVFPMLAGLGPILGEGDLVGGQLVDGTVGYHSYRDGQAGSAKVSGTPYALHNPDPPVAVLIGPNTASSGEMVAIAFIGRPDTRFFGQPSRGRTTGNRMFHLQDGAAINLASGAMVDRNGNSDEGGVVPDEIVDPGLSGSQEAGRPVIERALSWLGGEPDCQ